MPSYLPPRKGVSLAQAYAEAAAIAPVTRVMLHCFELWHPTMVAPVRVVNDHNDFIATLEPDAPRNPGEDVEHLACFARVERLEESADAAPSEVKFSIDNVNGHLLGILAAARGSRDLWQVIERVYASDDPTGPAVLPVLPLTFTKASMSGGTATLMTGYGDPANNGVPRNTFRPEAYLGLNSQ